MRTDRGMNRYNLGPMHLDRPNCWGRLWTISLRLVSYAVIVWSPSEMTILYSLTTLHKYRLFYKWKEMLHHPCFGYVVNVVGQW